MQKNANKQLKRDKLNARILVLCLLVLSYFQISTGIARRLDEVAELPQISNYIFFLIFICFIVFFFSHPHKQKRKQIVLLLLLIDILWGCYITTNLSFKDLFSSTLMIFWGFCFLFGCRLVNTDRELTEYFIRIINIVLVLPLSMYCLFAFFTTDMIVNQGSTDAFFAIVVYLPFVLMLQSNRQLKFVNSVLVSSVALVSVKRSILIGVSVSLLLFFLLTEHKKILTKWHFWLVLGFIIILGRYIYGIVSDTIIYRFLHLEADQGSGRELIYQTIYSSFQQAEWSEMIFGHGFQAVLHINDGKLAHDDFLQLLYDYGLVGVALYFVFMVSMVFSAVRCYKKRYFNKELYATYVGSLTLFLIMIFLNCFIYSIMLIAPIMLALGILKTRIENELI